MRHDEAATTEQQQQQLQLLRQNCDRDRETGALVSATVRQVDPRRPHTSFGNSLVDHHVTSFLPEPPTVHDSHPLSCLMVSMCRYRNCGNTSHMALITLAASSGKRKAPSTPTTMSKQHSTLSKESFNLQHSTMLLGQCCRCGRGLIQMVV